MPRYVAFLRAINVGGRVVTMDRLRALVESAGFEHVTSFIASGNVIFESPDAPVPCESLIETALAAGLGYQVVAMVRSLDELASVVRHVDEEKLRPAPGGRLYVGFLKTVPSRTAATRIGALSNEIDQLTVRRREVYWRSAGSFSGSTLTGAHLEKVAGTPATLRNFNTVERILAKHGDR